MPRIKLANADFEAAYAAETDPTRRLGIMQSGILGRRPDAAKLMAHFVAGTKHGSTLPQRLLEMIRLRIAFHNQCRSCMAQRFQEAIDDGLTDDVVCSLEKPDEAPDLTPAERVALMYADLMATNHLAINDAVYDELRRYYSETELVDLGLLCGIYVGIGRFMASLLMVEDLPEGLTGPASIEKTYAPWGVQGLVFEPLPDPV